MGCLSKKDNIISKVEVFIEVVRYEKRKKKLKKNPKKENPEIKTYSVEIEISQDEKISLLKRSGIKVDKLITEEKLKKEGLGTVYREESDKTSECNLNTTRVLRLGDVVDYYNAMLEENPSDLCSVRNIRITNGGYNLFIQRIRKWLAIN